LGNLDLSNTQTDRTNCGACGNVCNLPNAVTTACIAGVCEATSCAADFQNCSGNPAAGCDTNVSTSRTNCGTCGNVCNLPNATATVCVAGVCEVAACPAGYSTCNGPPANGCINLSTSRMNCGACGNVCNLPNAITTGCFAGVCEATSCAAGFQNCSGNPATGCETNLTNSSANCGACGNACAPTQSCVNGVCQ
jgi:hypothetical protein